MSLLKVSDLEGLTYEQISSNEQFKQALFEVSNPVSAETTGVWSYKSQYVKMCDFLSWTGNSISSFDNPISFLGGINLSGNLCCNVENPDNDFFAKMYFGDYFDIHTGSLSATADDSMLFRSNLFELYNGQNRTMYLTQNQAGLCVDLNMNGKRIINLGNPSTNSDAVNKQYIDMVSANIIHNHMPLSGNFGMFASCDYVVTSAIPSIADIRQRVEQTGHQTFYFVIKPESES